jgi:hypothetical protein
MRLKAGAHQIISAKKQIDFNTQKSSGRRLGGRDLVLGYYLQFGI